MRKIVGKPLEERFIKKQFKKQQTSLAPITVKSQKSIFAKKVLQPGKSHFVMRSLSVNEPISIKSVTLNRRADS
jgi:hypothetical protein